MKPCHLLALVPPLLAAAPPSAWAAPGPPQIESFERAGARALLQFRAEADSYYMLQRSDDLAGAWSAIDSSLGGAGSQTLEDDWADGARAFYAVERIPLGDPFDTDGDGIDDVYELRHGAALDPLEPGDAARVSAATGNSHLEDYLAAADGSNRFVYNYQLGRGIHDITGLAAGGGMMGYAEGEQVSTGIHDRQWARAFVFAGRDEGSKRVAFVVVDSGQVFHSVTRGVVEKIAGDPQLAGRYDERNIVLSATHTHGAAGGHSYHVLYNASIGGFSWRTYDAMVHGIYMAIKKADADAELNPGRLLANSGSLPDANENRRPRAYGDNIEFVRRDLIPDPYPGDNRDTEMLCLRFEGAGRSPRAMLNWFPVHGVSVSKFNTLLTGDNKGRAAYLFEKGQAASYPGYAAAGSGFVAGFANSNPGDLTANLRDRGLDLVVEGVFDADGATDLDIDFTDHLTQGAPYRVENVRTGARSEVTGFGEHQLTISLPLSIRSGDSYRIRGGWIVVDEGDHSREEDYRRAEIIGERQFRAAMELFENAGERIAGEIDYRHAYVRFDESFTVDPGSVYPYNIPGVGFPFDDAVPRHTCTGALGAEFAKGTLDGEGLASGLIDAFIASNGIIDDPVTDAFEECHFPKEVILTTGTEALQGQTWTPQVLPVSILKVGDLAILAVPAEFTVMAGARLRRTVESVFAADGEEVRTIIAGLSNSYSGYVTTYEEYLHREPGDFGVLNQGYEAASTQFGAFTLVAYQHQFTELAQAIVDGRGVASLAMPDTPAPAFPLLAAEPLASQVPIMERHARAVYKEPAGCPDGQFLDPGTGFCWSCPEGYQRTVFPIVDGEDRPAADGCEKPSTTDYAAASRHGAATCPAGQFLDLATGACWSCPSGYDRTVFDINGATACERPAETVYRAAAQHGGPGCGVGQFFDIGTGKCWSCPSGYNRTVFDVSGPTACELPAHDVTTTALTQDGTGFFGTDCPSGYAFDALLGKCWKCPSGYGKISGTATCVKTVPADFKPATAHDGLCPAGQFLDIGTGKCWSCPSGYDRTVFAVTGDSACEKRVPAAWSGATRHGGLCPAGQFLDIGTGRCWSCPSGFVRGVLPVTGDSGCVRVNAPVFAAATRWRPFACSDRNPLWFLDIGRNECWSCEGWDRTLAAVDSPEACVAPLAERLVGFGDYVRTEAWDRNAAPQVFRNDGRAVASIQFWAGQAGWASGTESNRLLDAQPTFAAVQRRFGADDWRTVATDADWEVTVEWEAGDGIPLVSETALATVTWEIPEGTPAGRYRLVHSGHQLPALSDNAQPYSGISPVFRVTAP